VTGTPGEPHLAFEQLK